jgi:hypothetical protein
MKLISVVFIVCIIVLVFVLINILYSKNWLVNQNYLGTGLIPIPMKKITDYQSNSYFYEIWIYANSVDTALPSQIPPPTQNPHKYESTPIPNAGPSNLPGNIFYVDDSISLDLYKNTSLCVNVSNTNPSTRQAKPYDSYIVTSEFPLQKWQQVIIHVQNYLMDFYLNGKLVKSTNLTSTNGVSIPSTTASINFGKADAYIAKFNRLTSVLNTNVAWKRYLDGNSTLVPIHANLTLTVDPEKTVSHLNLF